VSQRFFFIREEIGFVLQKAGCVAQTEPGSSA